MKKRDAAREELGLGGLFKGLGNFLDLVAKMAEKGENETTRTGEFTGPGGKYHGVYGFSVRLGLGGRPVVEKFGNIRDTDDGPLVDEVREPIVDVLDEGRQLLIIAELPGIEEESVTVNLDEGALKLHGAGKDRVYRKESALPVKVDPASRKLSYRNGILEIRLAKKEDA